MTEGLNPYFIGLPILIHYNLIEEFHGEDGLNPYFIGLPILMIEWKCKRNQNHCLNPYFIGLPILIVAPFVVVVPPVVVSILILLDYLFL